MSEVVLDGNHEVYPSVKGATRQIIDALNASSDFSWYSFKRPIYGHENNEVLIEAISYDENGDEEKFYLVKISVTER